MTAAFAGCDTNSGNKVSPVASALTVTPSTLSLTAGQSSAFVFVATGGNSNYAWAVSTPELGTITPSANGTTATYQSTTNAGVNVVEVTDGSSGAATATVTQR
jgi:hypothetical protein